MALRTSAVAKSASSEVTPLLDTSDPTSEEELLLHQQKHIVEIDNETPPHFRQVALLCYCRMVEPVAFFSIFPFINKMIQETGIDEADVGFYSGLVESLFSLTQMVLMIWWGKAADRYGRKPVLVFSLSAVAACTSLFGLSKTIWQMILFRCISGVFAGSIVTIRAMISENSTPKTQAMNFAFFAFTAFLGNSLGPMLAMSFVYLSISFINYPYALPTFAAGLFGARAALVAAFFVEETLSKSGGRDSVVSEDVKMTTCELLKFPGVAMVLFIFSNTMMMAFANIFTTPELGGFGFEPLQVSLFLGITGISQAAWTLLAFPPMQHRFGTKGVLLLLQHKWMLAFWVIAPINTVIGGSVSMAFTCVQLAVNDISPSHHTLGLISDVSLVLPSATRAFAPTFFASVYAFGVGEQVFGRYLIWFVLIAFALVLTLAAPFLPKRPEGILKHDDD